MSRRNLAARFAVVLTALTTTLGCQEQPDSILDGSGGSGASSSNDGGAGATAPSGGAPSDGGAGDGAGNEGGQPPQPATFELSLDQAAPAIELRDSVELTVTITENGYVGDVLLTLGDVPSDVGAELSATSVTLDGSGTETVTLTLTSASDTQSGDIPISVTGFCPGGEKVTDATLTIAPVITITIPVNLASFSSNPPDTTAFGDYPTVIKAPPNMSAENPVTVNFFNADTVSHEIHADDTEEGFGHGTQGIPAGSLDPVVREVNTPGVYDYYPHDIGTTILGQIVIE